MSDQPAFSRREGKYNGNFKDLTGQKFGYLTAKYFVTSSQSKNGYSGWMCQCDCGNEHFVSTKALTSGNTSSCGCYEKERKFKHGQSRTKLYYIWSSMRERCNKPEVPNYRFYGAKGIKVCAEWEQFIPFRDWALANGYEEGLSIERKDSTKGYEPSNCTWIPRYENALKGSLGRKDSEEVKLSRAQTREENYAFRRMAELERIRREYG
jgi:hypothetical protein